MRKITRLSALVLMMMLNTTKPVWGKEAVALQTTTAGIAGPTPPLWYQVLPKVLVLLLAFSIPTAVMLMIRGLISKIRGRTQNSKSKILMIILSAVAVISFLGLVWPFG